MFQKAVGEDFCWDKICSLTVLSVEIKLLQLVAVSDKKCGFFLCTISNPAPPSFLSSQPLLNHKALLRLLNSRIIPMEFLCMSSNI
jgi:hypothetical protein